MKIGTIMQPLECQVCFSMDWPSDLVFKTTLARFKLDINTVLINILYKFVEDWANIEVARAQTPAFSII